MNEHRDYELVALISKSKGLRGEIIVRSSDGLPLNLYEGLEVWIVPPPLGAVRHTRVALLREQAKGLIVTLEGLVDPDDARKLVGRYLLARKSDIEAAVAKNALVGFGAPEASGLSDEAAPEVSDGGAPEASDGVVSGLSDGGALEVSASSGMRAFETAFNYVGCAVYDEKEGFIGRIRHVQKNPAQPLLIVESGQHEVLIPCVDEFIVRREGGRIDVRLPRGLTELNR